MMISFPASSSETHLPDRPYVVLSAAASLDGYTDDTTDHRLLLSNDEDFDRVDEVRAGVDAILVGANTIRQDNPDSSLSSPRSSSATRPPHASSDPVPSRTTRRTGWT
jgi:5-amino-6-(5-phosphoribosylamino)uracil reductase